MIILSYLFAGFYLVITGIESLPQFDETHNKIVTLFYTLGIMGISIITAAMTMVTLFYGFGKNATL